MRDYGGEGRDVPDERSRRPIDRGDPSQFILPDTTIGPPVNDDDWNGGVKEGVSYNDAPPITRPKDHADARRLDSPESVDLGVESTAQADFVKSQVQLFRKAIEDLRENVSHLEERLAGDISGDAMDALREFQAEAVVTCDDLLVQFEGFTSGTGPQVQVAVSVSLSLESLGQGVEDLAAQAAAASPTQTVPGQAEQELGRLMRWIKKATRHLWALISRLLTPKEWTLKGQLKAIPFLASAEIEITFGA